MGYIKRWMEEQTELDCADDCSGGCSLDVNAHLPTCPSRVFLMPDWVKGVPDETVH